MSTSYNPASQQQANMRLRQWVYPQDSETDLIQESGTTPEVEQETKNGTTPEVEQESKNGTTAEVEQETKSGFTDLDDLS